MDNRPRGPAPSPNLRRLPTVAGRIREEDIALVRERSPIADVVGEHLQLRSAGAGQLKGLCPFHEEKTPSFHVTPARGYYHCFGCQVGGDVITFVREIEHLSFAEAVELLARRVGVDLRYEQGGAALHQQQGQRTRLVAAHVAAAEFYSAQLSAPEAAAGRRFLAERGFDSAAAETFGVGYAPTGWDVLLRHLRDQGFADRELMLGGLAREGQRGPIDRFRGRLVWPIRDLTGDVIGFGARKLQEDDPAPKYLNTPETPIYKKGHVLYAADMAKREISRRQQAVIVEGYTDVMACHLAGVPTAVATCGTSFGEDHIKVLRRLLMDQHELRGEVVFTFDGDEAGQRAALRAFADDQRFVAQTFVAVQPDGLDPCELRQREGDAAVRDLIARRVPLFEFAVRSIVRRHDLERPEGRTAALTAAVPVVARIRDGALRDDYARQLAGWVGVPEPMEVVARVRTAGGGPSSAPPRQRSARPPTPDREGGARPADERSEPGALSRPDPADPDLHVERESLKLALQRPALVGPVFDALDAEVFTAAGYAAVRRAVAAAGGVHSAESGERWVTRVLEHAGGAPTRSLVTELAVEPLRTADHDDSERYAGAVIARLREMATTRRVTELKSRLQRLNPVESTEAYNLLFGELIALEQHRRVLRDQASGTR
ncbi:DNA primase [soil metagenome]